MGHWETQFSVSDRDRNFNLKLAASKLPLIVYIHGGPNSQDSYRFDFDRQLFRKQ